MRIPCPYCGERDVREFVYLGDATVQRPDPQAADALEQFTDYVYLRDNPAGPHRELWYHGAGCQAWLVVDARHAHARDRRRRAGVAHAQPRRAALMGQTVRDAAAGRLPTRRPDRPCAARCASRSTAAPLDGLCRRHAGLGAARQRRAAGRPQLQVSPAARHPHRRLRGAERAGRVAHRRAARAEHARPPRSSSTTASKPTSQNRWPSLAFDLLAVNSLFSAVLRRRLLLQDLHVAGRVLGEASTSR